MPKEMVQLQALKQLRYRTRAFSAGDLFEATAGDARIFIAIKKAKKPERVPGHIPGPSRRQAAKFSALDHDNDGSPGGATKPAPDPDLPALREEYVTTLGKRPFPGWDAETLRQKIAESAAS